MNSKSLHWCSLSLLQYLHGEEFNCWKRGREIPLNFVGNLPTWRQWRTRDVRGAALGLTNYYWLACSHMGNFHNLRIEKYHSVLWKTCQPGNTGMQEMLGEQHSGSWVITNLHAGTWETSILMFQDGKNNKKWLMWKRKPFKSLK